MDENIFWQEIAGKINPPQKEKSKISLKDGKKFLTKVAFDLFKSDDGGIWQVEKDADGKEWLVRMDKEGTEEPKEWEATSDTEGSAVTLSYKKYPIEKFPSSVYGFDRHSISEFKNLLLKKMSSDEFLTKLLDAQPESKKEKIFETFPELKQISV